MEEKHLKILDEIAERGDWDELKKDVYNRLKNDLILVRQRLQLLELCDAELAKFPEEEETAGLN